MKAYCIALLLACTACAYAGQKVAIAEPTNVQESHSWAVELGAGYNWSMNKTIKSGVFTKKNHINTIGTDITGVYNIDDANAVTLRFGYAWGQDKFAVSHGEYIPGAWLKETVHTFSLMPGYRYTLPVGTGWKVYGGVNIGLANSSIKLVEHTDHDRHFSTTEEAHGSAWGFAYSLEAGARYSVSESLELFAAGTVSGNTAQAKVKYDGREVCKGNHQIYLGTRIGASYSF